MSVFSESAHSTVVLVCFGILLGCTPHEKKKELRHFRKSIDLRNEVARILSAKGKPRTTRWAAALVKMEECLAETHLVSDKALASLHSELPSRYRNEFCKGMMLCKMGMKQEDVGTILSGNRLLESFAGWYVWQIADDWFVP